MAITAVATGRGKYGRQAGQIAARRSLVADRERQLHVRAATPALSRRQHRRSRQRGCLIAIRLFAGENGARFGPAVQTRADQSDAVDVCVQSRHVQLARAKIRLQLVPPKPKELLSARLTACTRLSSR